ncbi:hypothetical protein HMI49_15785 [Corallococcus exercitus]|uniref:Uncharacterized protein n=1 Tax=Corallococcus exercitus TaxID=2316736 RepID=A0A7Y4KIX5_9BACT|nr:hypothetical protein [Corallococcus exercitus]NOK34661.1 hypothetical protein [Corallococcus exercitus]
MLKGALVGVDVFNAVAGSIIFQYNPDSLSRTLQVQGAGEDGARSEALRLRGAPVETIKLDVELDATDPLESNDPLATSVGIHPQLAALEMLLYPKSALVIANSVLMAAGSLEIVPPVSPLTLFIWGPKRVLPVRVSDITVTEEAYDNNLNPLRARVALSLRVLSYNDLSLTHPGYALFLTHQVIKETLATVSGTTSVASVLGGNVKLF